MNAVDTNVLIYACDRRDPLKQARALELVSANRGGVLLWQVACEFVAASRKLAAHGFTPADAWNRLTDFSQVFEVRTPSAGIWALAQELHLEQGVAFWDALLLSACREAGVRVLYSEDLPGGSVRDVSVVNPFV